MITTTPLDKDAEALLASRNVAMLVAEAGGELEKWLRRERATAAVVRPDRTVMCAGRDTAAVCGTVVASVSSS